MNGLEILGLACVDTRFRNKLFNDVESVIALNRTDLSWAEETGLRTITAKYVPHPKQTAAAKAEAKSQGDEPNPVPEELADVGRAMMKMCPEVPCPWPYYFTENPEPYPR